MPWLVATNATETFEQTLSNATIAAENSAQTMESVGYAASNAALASTVNTGVKSLSLSYGVALTSASAMDMVPSKNRVSKCMFAVGCSCGTIGTTSAACNEILQSD